ncbi:MAG: serine hydrolase domain-containing protein [Rhodomicrobium sp.]
MPGRGGAEPGERQAYHAVTLGYYEGELLRRIDPQHRTLGKFFQDEIASPLGLDFYIRLPEAIPNSRLATLESPTLWSRLTEMPLPLVLAAFNPRSNLRRAMVGTDMALDEERIYARELEVPSGGGVGAARAIAHAYSVFATGGHELGLRPETLEALKAPAVPPKYGFHDECLKGEIQFSLGFMKSSATWPFASPAAFGSPGAGGSLGFADPQTGSGYAYVPNRMRMKITGDPREVALRNAVFSCLQG